MQQFAWLLHNPVTAGVERPAGAQEHSGRRAFGGALFLLASVTIPARAYPFLMESKAGSKFLF
jgi:hypothetical protein